MINLTLRWLATASIERLESYLMDSNPLGVMAQADEGLVLLDEIESKAKADWEETKSIGFVSDGYGRYMRGTSSHEVDPKPYIDKVIELARKANLSTFVACMQDNLARASKGLHFGYVFRF